MSRIDCATCGKTPPENRAHALCSQCQTVSYCSVACQKSDWKSHKMTCQRVPNHNLAYCDICRATPNEVLAICWYCGTLFCEPCLDTKGACRGCSRPMHLACLDISPEGVAALEALVAGTSSNNKRRGLWCIWLGEYYQEGSETDKRKPNIEQAKMYYELAGTEHHYGEGYGKMGLLYQQEGNWRKAKTFLEKGAKLQYRAAMYNLGQSHYDGEFGAPPCYPSAMKWYKDGARLGDADCCYQLGDMYRRGVGTAVDFRKAVSWYRKGANLGHANSQNALGMRYDKGEGVPQCFDTAKEWWEKSAAQGDACAQQNLRVWYRDFAQREWRRGLEEKLAALGLDQELNEIF